MAPVFFRTTRIQAGIIMMLITAAGLTAAACSSSANETGPVPPEQKVQVVTTIIVLADLAGTVGGDLVEITNLAPPGADVHSFTTTPSHSISVGEADLIISNGAGLDGFLDPVLAGAKDADAVHLTVSDGLDPAELLEEEFPAEEEDHGSGDPHFWMNPIHAIYYVERIRDGLIQVDPSNAGPYTQRAAVYADKLRELDKEIEQILDDVPAANRHLVTFHDAYGHFVRRYGWERSAFVPSYTGDVTPADVVQIMERIRESGISAIFAEPQFNSGVLQQAAQDAGIKIGIIRSLVDDTVPTYEELIRYDARTLVRYLGGSPSS